MMTSILLCLGSFIIICILKTLFHEKFNEEHSHKDNIQTKQRTDPKQGAMDKLSDSQREMSKNLNKRWIKRNGDQFSSDENSAPYKTDLPRESIDNEDNGIIDDMLTSESESSPKYRRRPKKKARFHKIRNSYNNDENKENIANESHSMYSFAQCAKDIVISKTNLNDRHISEMKRFRAITPPLRQHIKLNLPEKELLTYLNHYVLNKNDLKARGYPYRYGTEAGFFRQPFCGKGTLCIASTSAAAAAAANFDVNAREFVPSYKKKNAERKLSCDSGQASGNTSSSSSASTDSESSENTAEWRAIEHMEKTCVRCRKEFYVNDYGEYLRSEQCTYHWGKFDYSLFGGKYSCCKSEKHSKGCTIADEHVWNGYEIGFNGPFDNFVDTENNGKIQHTNKVFALDCEMCYTGLGLECTKVTLVGSDGQKVYEKFIRPLNEIICYNTRFSGISKKHLASKNGSVATLSEVQKDLFEYIDADTILIGHALENDLRVLKIIHNRVIDTSVCFPHPNGPGFKYSLRTLTQRYLKRNIQDSDEGHSSFEDSRAALELILWRVRRDFRSVLDR